MKKLNLIKNLSISGDGIVSIERNCLEQKFLSNGIIKKGELLMFVPDTNKKIVKTAKRNTSSDNIVGIAAGFHNSHQHIYVYRKGLLRVMVSKKSTNLKQSDPISSCSHGRVCKTGDFNTTNPIALVYKLGFNNEYVDIRCDFTENDKFISNLKMQKSIKTRDKMSETYWKDRNEKKS